MKTGSVNHLLFSFFVGLSLLIAMSANAAIAVVTNTSGVLSVTKSDGTVKALYEKSELDVGDIVATEKDSYARLKFTDGGELTLRPGSVIKLSDYAFSEAKPNEDRFVFNLIKGGLRTITGLVGKRGNRDAYRLNTATSTIGIRGTHYGALLCDGNCGALPKGLYLDVVSGAINASNEAGGIDFSTGQFGYVADQKDLPVLLPGDPGLPAGTDGNKSKSTTTVIDGSGTNNNCN